MKNVKDEENEDWIAAMKELKEKTGIVIRTGEDDRVIMESGLYDYYMEAG